MNEPMSPADRVMRISELREIWNALSDIRARVIRLDADDEAFNGVVQAELSIGEQMAGERAELLNLTEMESTPAADAE